MTRLPSKGGQTLLIELPHWSKTSATAMEKPVDRSGDCDLERMALTPVSDD